MIRLSRTLPLFGLALLVGLALWGGQVLSSRREVRAVSGRVAASLPSIVRACAGKVGEGTLEETEMGPGYTAFTESGVTQWSLVAGWRSPQGRLGSLRCEAREEGGRVRVVSSRVVWRD